jgi:predicted nucleotidyltransferase
MHTKRDNSNLEAVYSYVVRPKLLLEKYYNDKLNERFWQNNSFNPEIREKLLKIAKDFYDAFDLNLPVLDIQLTGSMANYNYTDYSDLDVHVIVDFKEISSEIELVKKALDGIRFIWNLRHNLTIGGHDVELYIQDVNEQHTASGLYSLLKGKWVREPKYNPPEIDERDIKVKYEAYASEIEKLVNRVKAENLSPEEYMSITDRAAKLKAKIHQDRKNCLQTGNEFCVENLVFKELRNSELFGKLIQVGIDAYDKAYSEDELSRREY